jgi:hypothetical protein
MSVFWTWKFQFCEGATGDLADTGNAASPAAGVAALTGAFVATSAASVETAVVEATTKVVPAVFKRIFTVLLIDGFGDRLA